MSDLPSRQWFRDHAGVMLTDTEGEEWAIVAAYASGRLVDREHIDYEPGTARLQAWISSEFRGVSAPEIPPTLVRDIVDVVVGGSDEK